METLEKSIITEKRYFQNDDFRSNISLPNTIRFYEKNIH